MKLSKTQLDNTSTTIGLITGIIVALTTYDYLPKRQSGCVIAILMVINGYLTNKPAGTHPTTEEAEDKAIKD